MTRAHVARLRFSIEYDDDDDNIISLVYKTATKLIHYYNMQIVEAWPDTLTVAAPAKAVTVKVASDVDEYCKKCDVLHVEIEAPSPDLVDNIIQRIRSIIEEEVGEDDGN